MEINRNNNNQYIFHNTTLAKEKLRTYIKYTLKKKRN